MKHRIHVPEKPQIGATITISGEEFHHAARVVRVREGEEVEVFDGRGFAAHGKVVAIEPSAIHVEVDGEIEPRESPVRITLAQAIIQLDRFELVLQKATELGVAAIVPLVTDRVEVRAERYRGKAERWERIIFEAVKQSGRAVIPILEPPITFRDAIARDGVNVMFDADAEATELRHGAATLFIGPEGGWSDDELALARKNGARFQRLGVRRLRAETAAIVAVARFTT